MEFREGTADDFEAIVALTKEYCEETKHGWDADQARKYVLWCMGNTHIFVAEKDGEVVGAINFVYSKHHFSGEFIARKIAWYVLRPNRGRTGLKLLKMAEDKARTDGAKEFYCASPHPLTTDYFPLEVEYRKTL